MEQSPKIDAVICCYNEDPKKINKTLESCFKQSGQFRRVYLVDDGSERVLMDETQILTHPNLKIIRLAQNGGISAARNVAIRDSNADYVACINIEIILAPDWNKSCIDFLMSNPHIGCVFGRLIPYRDSLCTRWRMRFHELKYDGPSQVVSFAAGHAVLFNKKIVDEVGGYNEKLKLVMEDSDICERIRNYGFQTFFLAEASIVSLQDDTLFNLAKKHLIRCTSGAADEIGLWQFVMVSTRDFFVRLGRNVFKGRLYFLGTDICIYFLLFYVFIKRRRRIRGTMLSKVN